MGRRSRDGQPSKVLWVGYPPSLQIDEQMLHNAMILFGEIERIKSFPSRNYSFVEFRSVDEARRAKEGLQGRLFNDPRISIMFSSSELAPEKLKGKEKSYSGGGFYQGNKGPRPEMFYNELPFLPTQVGADDAGFGHSNHPVPAMMPNNFPSSGIPGALWRRPPHSGPGMMMLPPPPTGTRPAPGGWDVFDGNNQFQRELERDPKRSRLDHSSLPMKDGIPLRNGDDQGMGIGQVYGAGLDNDEGAMPLYGNHHQGNKIGSPVVGSRSAIRGPSMVRNDLDFIWRGTIAKGGTPVCHARCVPIGKGIGSELPGVVNCSARTGLDMLTKHYAEAVGFEIVFFLPDSENDFASYTEFLRYLGSKDRAGVAKLDDGTTLFLVPPSDFLTKVLNVPGPERLYGVVLKLPQQAPGGASMQQLSHQSLPSSQYIDRPYAPSTQTEYGLVPWKEEEVPQMGYNRVLKEESEVPPKFSFSHTSEPLTVQSAPQDYASVSSAVTSQAGVTLTPELIASLTSLLPAKSSAFESSQPLSGSSTLRPSFPASSGMLDTRILSQGWKRDHQSPDQMGHLPQHFGIQLDHQAQVGNQLTFPNVSTTPSHSAQMVHGTSQIQDSTFNASQQGIYTSRPLTNSSPSSQSRPFAASQQVNPQYEVEVPHIGQKGYGMDSPGFYGSTDFQQYKGHANLSNQVHGANFSQPQTVMHVAADKANPELLNQVQQLQSVLSGSGHGSSEGEIDKNQRYQSTLQFAASLLLQIQQQQQPGKEAGQGSKTQP